MSTVVTLRKSASASRGDWHNDELAELYRVEHALSGVNIEITSDRGLSDEGDPWFIFCRPDGTVLVHITRFDGFYHIFSPALARPLIGRNFSEIAKAFAAGVPLTQPFRDSGKAARPVALLSVLVATIFFAFDELVSEAHALTITDTAQHDNRRTLSTNVQQELLAARVAAHLGSSIPGVRQSDGDYSTLITAVQLAVLTGIGQAIDGTANSAEADGAPSTPARAPHDIEAAGQQVDAISERKLLNSAVFFDVSQQSVLEQAEAAAVSDVVSSAKDGEAKTAVSTTDDVNRNHGAEDVSHLAFHAGLIPEQVVSGQGDDSVRSAANEHEVRGMDVFFVNGFAKLEVSGTALLTVAGDGRLELTYVQAGALPRLHIAENSQLEVTINLPPAELGHGGNLNVQEITLAGGVDSELHFRSTAMAELSVVINSQGSTSNSLSLADMSNVSATSVFINGSQDVKLNEQIDLFAHSQLNVSGLNANFTLAVDLGSAPSDNSHLQFDGTNFIAQSNASIALINVEDALHVGIGVNLQRLLVGTLAEGHSAQSVAIELGNFSSTDSNASIGVLSATGATQLEIISTGNGSANQIKIIEAPNLEYVTLSGNTDLNLGRIIGADPTREHSFTLDARELSGALTFDVTSRADANGSVTVIGGSGNDIITDLSSQSASVLSGGAGHNTFQLAAGDGVHTITDLKAGDKVVIGEGLALAKFSNLLQLTQTSQTTIEDQQNVLVAAQTAANFVGSSDEPQAVLFSYHGSTYVYVESGVQQAIHTGHEAVVKITGVLSPDLTNVFYAG